jgi:chemotaxis protein MotB
MIKNHILLFFISIAIFSSCVTPKIYNELVAKEEQTEKNSKKIKSENISLNTENVELKDKLSRVEVFIKKLEKDTSDLGSELRKSRSKYNALNQSYELLAQKNSNMIESKSRESKKLLEKLQEAKDDLQLKEDRLNLLEQDLSVQQQKLDKTQQELDDRERKVVELEGIVNRKDSVLLALKNRISTALLGFEGDGLTITQKNGKVYISLEEQLLFASGSWTVDSRGQEALSKLAKSLESQKEINILIEGHTDNIAFGGRGQIKDNWDLSVARATSIVRILTENSSISEQRLTAAGRGEFMPIADNSTNDGRSANRRIEIILSPKLDDLYQLLDN